MRYQPAAGRGSKDNRGCGILFLVFFALMSIAFTVGFGFSMREGIRSHVSYVEGLCTIVDERLISNTDSDGATTYRPEFTFVLSVGGEELVIEGFNGMEVSSSGRAGKQRILDRYEIGETYPCFYDPDNPANAVLEKPSWTSFLFLLAPLSLAGVALVLLLFSRRRGTVRGFERSAPRYAAAKASRRASPGLAELESEPFLGPVPTSEAGRQLSYRLPQDESEKSTAIFLFAFGLIWTGFSAWAFSAARSDGDGCAVFFLGGFVLIGLGVLAAAIRQAITAWGTGKTILEVSRMALSPGDAFEAVIEQHGHMHMNFLQARLVCREKAVYRQGTDRRTAIEEVVDLPLDRVEKVVVSGRIQRRFDGRIPRSAMHSFKSRNNEVQWWIVVTGDIERWPDFKRSYRLRVLPRSGVG